MKRKLLPEHNGEDTLPKSNVKNVFGIFFDSPCYFAKVNVVAKQYFCFIITNDLLAKHNLDTEYKW